MNTVAYKPSGGCFEYMIEKLGQRGIPRSEILHVAESLHPDHEPANRIGLASCWIYRRFDQPGFGATLEPQEMPKYNFQFNSMADLARAHLQELRS